MTTLLESMHWRYATKKYDTSKKVSASDIETLKQAIQLSVSSMGLQPYKVLIVENPELREQLKAAAFGQSAITDASHLIVFAHERNVGSSQIEAYMKNISETRGVPIDSLDGFSTSIHNFVGMLSEEQRNDWAKKQAYIALSTLINTAAFLKIDATPMEGFNASEFDSILKLNERGLGTAVVAAIGYRHEADTTQHFKKVRKSTKELFIQL